MCAPVPDDPQDAQVASHYLNDFDGFQQTAREWTKKYAKEDMQGVDPLMVRKLMDMGFDQQQVVQALIASEGNEEAAIDVLLSS